VSGFQRAKRDEVWLKIGMSGPSGSGKTMSSLLMAKGLVGDWEKVAVLDTENKSASLYSHLGPYQTLDMAPPYDPRRYVSAIEMAEKAGFKALIIDSTTHEWNGEGGCLEMVNKIGKTKKGGNYVAWADVTPWHDKFINAILQSNMHIFCCTRRKQEYDMVKEDNRTRVVKLGTKEIQRDGFEYELTVAFSLDMEGNLATASKDRTGLFMGEVPVLISEKTGEMLAKWNRGEIQSDAKTKV